MLEIKNRYTGNVIAKIHETRLSGAVESIRSSGNYHNTDLMDAMNHALTKNFEELSKSITEETGKPLTFSRFEVETCVSLIRSARSMGVGSLSYLNTESSCSSAGDDPLFPYALFPSFHNPLLDSVRGAILSIASGGFPVIFPDPYAPLTLQAFSEMIRSENSAADLPIIITGLRSGRVLTEIFKLSGIRRTHLFGNMDHISGIFRLIGTPVDITVDDTGSTAAFVWKDADLNSAIDYVCNGAFFNWTAYPDIRLLIVHPEISEYFMNQIKERASSIRVVSPADEEAVLAPVSGKSDLDIFESYVRNFIAAGGRKIAGGVPFDGKFITPALFGSDSSFFALDSLPEVKTITLVEAPTISGAVNMMNSFLEISTAACFTSDLYLLNPLIRNIRKKDIFMDFYPGAMTKGSAFNYPDSILKRLIGISRGKSVHMDFS